VSCSPVQIMPQYWCNPALWAFSSGHTSTVASRRQPIRRVPQLKRNLDYRLEPENRVGLCLCHLWSKPTLTIIRSRLLP
jgi:hypothetical protein